MPETGGQIEICLYIGIHTAGGEEVHVCTIQKCMLCSLS